MPLGQKDSLNTLYRRNLLSELEMCVSSLYCGTEMVNSMLTIV
jgi:hypothetical protein